MQIIEAKSVSKKFANLPVLLEVSLDVNAGQLVAIIGRSGSGKSTFLRCLNGLETIDDGEIRIAGHIVTPGKGDLRALRRDVGIVFQSYNLFPHLTIEKNITLAPRLVHKLPREKARHTAMAALERVHLADKIDAYPDQLSGGQQQRVAIARSLAMSPKVMLFDEVTSALDPELTGEVLKVMEELSTQGMTMVIVTHEMGFAERAADTIHFMNSGRIWESGPPDRLLVNPHTTELRQFLGSTL